MKFRADFGEGEIEDVVSGSLVMTGVDVDVSKGGSRVVGAAWPGTKAKDVK